MVDRVTLYIEGLMLEKLVERALAAGADLSELRRLSRRELLLSAPMRSAKIVSGLCARYAIRCEVRGERGKSAYLRRIKERATLPVALLVCAALTFAFLGRVWIVDVRVIGGGVPSDAVYAALEEYGAVAGAQARKIDTSLISTGLTALSGYSYASVAREGIALVVELAEEKEAPELYDISYARDLVAARDCVILSVDVKAGTAMVKPGDTVRRGQVLISGHEMVSREDSRSVGALGTVTARVWVEGEAREKTRDTVRTYTGRESSSSRVTLFHWSVSLTSGEEYEAREEMVERLPVGGLFLPLVIERTTRREYVEQSVPRDEAALKAALTEAAFADAAALRAAAGLDRAEMIDKWKEFSMIDTDTLRARAVYELRAEVQVTRDQLEGNEFGTDAHQDGASHD
jgi:similar to stage IV sporulation protein